MKEHAKIVLLGRAKLDAIAVLISKTLNESFISQEEFASINNVLRECNEMKGEIKNTETS